MKTDKLSQDLLTQAVDQLNQIKKLTTMYNENDPCYLLGIIAARTDIYIGDLLRLVRTCEKEDSDRE